MVTNQSPFAQNDPAPHPKRVWDSDRQCFDEAMGICRNADGTFRRKSKTKFEARLFPLWEDKRGAA
jgi:hypothetical protein